MRQLTASSGDVVLARAYDPYGNLVENNANTGVTTAYGYSGEYSDASDMVYLRARYYSPAQGRFVSKDLWKGNYSQPQSLNGWNYVNNNPVNYRDPSGYIKQGTDSDLAEDIRNELLVKYNVLINKDWGEYAYTYYPDPTSQTLSEVRCGWKEGNWKSSYELEKVKEAIYKISPGVMSILKFKSAYGSMRINRLPFYKINDKKMITSFAPPGKWANALKGDVILTDFTMAQSEDYILSGIIHEFGHVWDYRSNNQLSMGLMKKLNTWKYINGSWGWYPFFATIDETTLETYYPESAPDTYENCPAGPPDSSNSNPLCRDWPYSATYGGFPLLTQPGAEDWAQSFAAYVYNDYFTNYGMRGLKSTDIRYKYVVQKINNIK